MSPLRDVAGTVPDCAKGRFDSPRLVARTLEVARVHAERHGINGGASSGSPADDVPHPLVPALGSRSVSTFLVGDEDTAAAMGHPDASMTILGSPRIGLWFEIATSPLMPDIDAGVQHVGVGLVVHHLGMANVGDEVRVGVEVLGGVGRTVQFGCDAWCDGRLIASGAHHRVLLRSP